MKGLVAITGAAGLLGQALSARARARGHEILGIARHASRLLDGTEVEALDLTAKGAADRLFECRPAIVVHAAALTDIDACESRPLEARALHVDASRALAACAAVSGSRFVHVSTDAVFSGTEDRYDESSPPKPLNVYARTKAEGERRVLEAFPGALVVRTNLFGSREVPGKSLAEWGLGEMRAGREVPGFVDVTFNPLWAGHLADALLDLAGTNAAGLLHLGSATAATKHEFLRRMATAFGFDPACVREARASERPWRAPRPACTVLDARRAQALLGRPFPGLSEGLDAFAAHESSRARPPWPNGRSG